MCQFSIFIANRRKHKTTDIWRCAKEDQCVPDKTGCSCQTTTRSVRLARQGCWCCACRWSSPVLLESYCRTLQFMGSTSVASVAASGVLVAASGVVCDSSLFSLEIALSKTTPDIWRCASEEQCVPDKQIALVGQQQEAFSLQGWVGCWYCTCRSSSLVLQELCCRIPSSLQHGFRGCPPPDLVRKLGLNIRYLPLNNNYPQHGCSCNHRTTFVIIITCFTIALFVYGTVYPYSSYIQSLTEDP